MIVRPGLHAGLGCVLALLALAACERRATLVADEAALFEEQERQQLALFHGLLLADHDIDYRVLTVASAADVSKLAHDHFNDLQIGSLSRSGFGLLLVIDVSGGQVRMEVGYGLEGYFPDGFVAYVEQRQMVPFFASDRVADGILATTELIVDRAQRYELGEPEHAESGLAGSGGGGATSRIEAPAPVAPTNTAAERPAGRLPQDTLSAYFAAMARREASSQLALFTPETRAMLKDWVMTPAQMDTVVATYRRCRPQRPLFDATSGLAVIRYPVSQRKCAPWFFRRDGDSWQLDLTMMRLALRFGRDNSWHFEPGVGHPYAFAFNDWRFDRHGFPISQE